MKQDRDYTVLISALIFVGTVILVNFLGSACLISHQQEQINKQQEQIDSLVKKNHVQDLRLKILEQI